MVNVRQRKCKSTLCSKQPRFGSSEDSQALYCGDHKRDSDEDVVEKRSCVNVQCTSRPTFGAYGGSRPLRCKTHKEYDDVDLVSRKCIDCDRQPSFGIAGHSALYCKFHKTNNMVNTRHRLCEQCDTSARYGFAGHGDIFCTLHREIGTILNANRQCVTDKCRKLAEYGVTKHEHCELHKDPLEINLVNRKCSACGLMGSLNRNEQCETCRPELWEKKALYKQRVVIDYLKNQDLVATSEDRVLDKGICGKERPDLFFANDDQPHTVIGEIDEDQHKSYDCARICTCDGLSCNCDITRMKNIQQSQGGRPGYFIRFNPDAYKDAHKKVGKASDIERLKTLERWIRHLLATTPTAFLQVVYLYYDGHDSEKVEVETLVDWHSEAPTSS